jgi:hypothetical protein
MSSRHHASFMEFPVTIGHADAVIVRENTADGPRFVVHSRRAPLFTCGTFAEAEARTLVYAAQARACVWYSSARGLQLVARPPLSARTT